MAGRLQYGHLSVFLLCRLGSLKLSNAPRSSAPRSSFLSVLDRSLDRCLKARIFCKIYLCRASASSAPAEARTSASSE